MKIYPRKIIVRVITTDNLTLCYSSFAGWQGEFNTSIYSVDLLHVIYELLSCIVYTQCFHLQNVLIYNESGVLIDTITMDTFLLEFMGELKEQLIELPTCPN